MDTKQHLNAACDCLSKAIANLIAASDEDEFVQPTFDISDLQETATQLRRYIDLNY